MISKICEKLNNDKKYFFIQKMMMKISFSAILCYDPYLDIFPSFVSLVALLPYWLASRPIKGRASALSVLQSESYLLTDQLCNNHVQHSRTLLTLTGGHLDLWPYELQPRVFFLCFVCWYWKYQNWDFRVVKKCMKLSKKYFRVFQLCPRRPDIMCCRPRSFRDCPCSRLGPSFLCKKNAIFSILN